MSGPPRAAPGKEHRDADPRPSDRAEKRTSTGAARRSTAGSAEPTSSPDLSAAQVLTLAAEHSALASTATGAYWLTATETHELKLAGAADNRYKLDDGSATERWTARSDSDTGRAVEKGLPMRPATAADLAAWQRAGSPATVDLSELNQIGKPVTKPDVPMAAQATTVTEQPARDTVHGVALAKSGSGFVIGDRQLTLAQIRQLPSDQASLTKILLSGYPANAKLWTQDRWLFSTAADVLVQPVTPGVRASLYRILAGLTSVHSAGPATDLKGRTGTAVALTWSGPQGTEEDRLIIDVKAGTLLARETRLVKPIAALSWLHATDLWQTTVITRSGWTDDTPPAK